MWIMKHIVVVRKSSKQGDKWQPANPTWQRPNFSSSKADTGCLEDMKNSLIGWQLTSQPAFSERLVEYKLQLLHEERSQQFKVHASTVKTHQHYKVLLAC